MKIAIISFYLMESSIPLAKHLSLSGCEVDLFAPLPYKNQNAFVFNLNLNKQASGFVNQEIADKAFGRKLIEYLSTLNLKVFIFPDRRLERLTFKDLIYAYKLGRYIRKGKYDVVHIIHTSQRFWFFLYLFIEKKKVIQTLHEVTSHDSKTSFSQRLILKLLIKNSTPIIFHSKISKERFIEFRKAITHKKLAEENLAIIKFGLFETYKNFSNHAPKQREDGRINLLNFGRIVPYKGIDLLVESVKLLQEKYPIHLTIAGNGEPYFNLETINSYEFINRIISNEEIVSLIEASDIIVLPYKSASQSGIPMTVYIFNKPIIASNIAGFKEDIDHCETGILVNSLNAESFATAIELLIAKPLLRQEMQMNIKKKYSEGKYSWQTIANETIDFYKRLRKEIRINV